MGGGSTLSNASRAPSVARVKVALSLAAIAAATAGVVAASAGCAVAGSVALGGDASCSAGGGGVACRPQP